MTGASPAAAKQPAGTADLFAALLAMLGIGQAAGGGAAPAGAADAVGVVSQLLTGAATPDAAADTASAADPAAAVPTSTPPAALFKQLKDALAALNDALGQGQSLDPDLKHKLDQLADALAGLLGLPVAQPGLPVSPDPAGGDADGVIAAASANQPPAAPPIDPASPLGQAIAELAAAGKALAATTPALAQKLGAIADKLASGDVPDEVLAKLGLDATMPTTPAAAPAVATRPAAAEPPQGFAPVALTPPTVASASASRKEQAADRTSPPTPDDAAPAEAADAPLRRAVTPVATPPTHDGAAPKPAAKPDDAAAAAAAPAVQDSSTGSDTVAAPAAAPSGTTSAAATAPATPASDARAAQAAYQLPAAAAIPQVAFEVARQAAAGNSRFQIRLDPPELGRIDVKLDVDKHGGVTARMTVEKSETLDLMQRDQRSLEKALAQAGLDGQKTSLEFSLKQNPSGGSGNGAGRELPTFTGGSAAAESEPPPAAVTTLYRGTASPGGLNLFV